MYIQRFPIECQIFLTRKCNISCEYCTVPSKYIKGTELNLEEWLTALRRLKKWGIEHIKLLGGDQRSLHIFCLYYDFFVMRVV